jgi:hypothetical protein
MRLVRYIGVGRMADWFTNPMNRTSDEVVDSSDTTSKLESAEVADW